MMRFITALALATGITLALFYLMQSLIQSGEGVFSEAPAGNVLDFVRVRQDETPQKKERKPKKPPKPEEPPPPMEQPRMQSQSPNNDSAAMDFSTDVQADVALSGGLNLDSSDGEYLPIVKVAPVYPRRALSRGIEGYVIVEFMVDKTGAVKQPIVIEAKPQSLFDQAALNAALKFKYKPRVVNGEAVEVAGVQNRITFEIKG